MPDEKLVRNSYPRISGLLCLDWNLEMVGMIQEGCAVAFIEIFPACLYNSLNGGFFDSKIWVFFDTSLSSSYLQFD